jgi:hypothetical protein
MNAPFVKYCSMCGQANLAIASFCEDCDADLINTPVEMRREDNARIGEEEVPSANISPANASLNASLANASSVSAPPHQLVHEADQDELATRRADSAPGSVLELELVANPALKFSIRPGQSVGRASKADVTLTGVPDLEYISRAHARFTQRRTQWYVQYIAEGNSITVDGMESRDDAEIAIYDQSIIVLSFTAFVVRLA